MWRLVACEPANVTVAASSNGGKGNNKVLPGVPRSQQHPSPSNRPTSLLSLDSQRCGRRRPPATLSCPQELQKVGVESLAVLRQHRGAVRRAGVDLKSRTLNDHC